MFQRVGRAGASIPQKKNFSGHYCEPHCNWQVHSLVAVGETGNHLNHIFSLRCARPHSLTIKYISDLYHQDTMDYPSFSLKQDVIDQTFSSELKPSRMLYFKEYRKQQKESMLKNPVVEKCDQCDYQNINQRYMFQHKRVHHSDTKQQCSECDFSHFYPNRVRTHFKQVHLGIKRKKKCQKDSCEYFGTAHCLAEHSLLHL